MNPNILAEYLKFINEETLFQERLLDCHRQAKTLLDVLLVSQLSSYSVLTLHNYLGIISDIICQAERLSEDCMKRLYTNKFLLDTKPPDDNEGAVH